MAFNNSQLGMIRGHFITVKIFLRGCWGQRGGHGGSCPLPSPP